MFQMWLSTVTSLRRAFLLVAVAVTGVGAGNRPIGVGSSPIQKNGQLLREGRRYQGIGVNYYDAFVRTLENPSRTSYVTGFRELARRRIPFVRFSAGGYWPREWSLYQTNRADYFARLDGVVRCAETNGVGLIPSLFWQLSTIPDLVGEPCNRWGRVDSRTHQFMRTYTQEVVTRYRTSPAIWGWEFGNEYNLPADLPNAAEHRPPVVASLGTPEHRSADDDVSQQDVRVALSAFAQEVRRWDNGHFLSTGNAFPRTSAWHQAHGRTWTKDTPEQFAEVLRADNPALFDCFSVRLYEPGSDLTRLPAAVGVAQESEKFVFVGEFGVLGPEAPETRQQFQSYLAALTTHQVSLAALWVYEFDGQAKDWDVRPGQSRAWQLEAIQEENAKLAAAR